LILSALKAHFLKPEIYMILVRNLQSDKLWYPTYRKWAQLPISAIYMESNPLLI